mmetsp:Transcript_23427/g.50134  ORF Transcript_23427/g.50134 Transcript_23427/m.50134 type:complete len:307 (+) Transcript_23427:758-1678(+)
MYQLHAHGHGQRREELRRGAEQGVRIGLRRGRPDPRRGRVRRPIQAQDPHPARVRDGRRGGRDLLQGNHGAHQDRLRVRQDARGYDQAAGRGGTERQRGGVGVRVAVLRDQRRPAEQRERSDERDRGDIRQPRAEHLHRAGRGEVPHRQLVRQRHRRPREGGHHPAPLQPQVDRHEIRQQLRVQLLHPALVQGSGGDHPSGGGDLREARREHPQHPAESHREGAGERVRDRDGEGGVRGHRQGAGGRGGVELVQREAVLHAGAEGGLADLERERDGSRREGRYGGGSISYARGRGCGEMGGGALDW